MHQPPHRISRRTFIRSIAYAGAALPVLSPRLVRAVSPNGKLRHVSFGSNGMAWADINSLATHERFSLYAVCDVDERNFAQVHSKFPEVKTYTDFRVLLEKESEHFDAANVTVPDHMHAPIAMSLLRRGKPVYCQKPLTHDVHEARQLRLAAEKAGVATQMGIQVHSRLEYRLGVHLAQSGVLGRIQEVHAWSGKNWGGIPKPDRSDTPPAGFHWDSWIGVGPATPFLDKIYHPGEWRRWLPYGTGTFGDMGCHIYDPVFEALGVDAPLTVKSVGPAPTADGWPTEAQVHYTFPGTEFTTDPVRVTWYDGGRLPPAEVLAVLGEIKPPGEGSIFLGEQGAMLMPHVAAPRLLPVEKFRDVKYPKIETTDHWHQFVNASLGEGKTLAPFSYAGPLTEAVLLGGVAVRFPNEELAWDGPAMKFAHHPQGNGYLRREYRRGWEIEGL